MSPEVQAAIETYRNTTWGMGAEGLDVPNKDTDALEAALIAAIEAPWIADWRALAAELKQVRAILKAEREQHQQTRQMLWFAVALQGGAIEVGRDQVDGFEWDNNALNVFRDYANDRWAVRAYTFKEAK